MPRDRRAIYLDHAATTPTDPRVVEAMLPFFTEIYGNASSAHQFGRRAESAVERARETVAGVLNCQPKEIVFTSCGSESDNLAVRGVAWTAGPGAKLVTTPIEHTAVLKTIQQLAEHQGFEMDLLPVDTTGMVQIDAFAERIQGTALVSVMYANNEVGTVQPIADLAETAREHGVVFHTDAVQAPGQLSLDVDALGVDLLSLSAHKFYGPKGIGILYVRDGIEIMPSQTGGSHERGLRAGTLNTAFIVGAAKALELAHTEQDAHVERYQTLRDRLINGVLCAIPDAQLTGHPTNRLSSHASFVFGGVDANTLIMHLDMKGIAASSASACKTGNPEPSSVLMAMGYAPEIAKSSLRLTVGRQTTEKDIDFAVGVITDAVARLQKMRV